jgi:hypothetical protein
LYWGTRQQNENDKRPDKVPRPCVWVNGNMYQVVVKGKYVGLYDSIDNAIRARDAFMERV